LRGSGASLEVYAHGSGEAVLGKPQGFSFGVILKVTEDFWAREPVKQFDPKRPHEAKPGEPPEAISQTLKDRPDQPGSVNIIVSGQKIPATQVRRGGTNVLIRDLGKYPEIGKELAAKGLEDKELGKALIRTTRTGKGEDIVKNLIALQGVEAARMDTALISNRLLTLGLHRGVITSEQAFGLPGQEGSRLNPPSQLLSRQAVERLKKEDQGRPLRQGTAVQIRSDEQRQRYFLLIAKVAEQEVFRDEQHMRKRVEQLLAEYNKLIGRR
jgi:hypothetical protein